MPRKKAEKSPLQELAEQADKALALCWERLGTRTVSRNNITTMVQSWRVKRRAWMEVEEARKERKENRESDAR